MSDKSKEPVAADEKPQSPQPPSLAPRARSSPKSGRYHYEAGLGLTSVDVDVVSEKDGLYDLARAGESTSFVTACPRSDSPRSGHWTPC